MNNNLPEHIAIIMDGNGRWAKLNNQTRLNGHKKGVETVRKIINHSKKNGIKSLTLYTFSKDNWKRPKSEIHGLMDLLYITLKNEFNNFHKNDLKVNYIGDISSFPSKVSKMLDKITETTINNKSLKLNLALGYSSRYEILKAIKKIANDVLNNKLDINDIDISLVSTMLDRKIKSGDPDLLIRTGGEFRVSDFLLWEIAYSEIFFCNKYWPDFNELEYMKAITHFQETERRYGKISEQID